MCALRYVSSNCCTTCRFSTNTNALTHRQSVVVINVFSYDVTLYTVHTRFAKGSVRLCAYILAFSARQTKHRWKANVLQSCRAYIVCVFQWIYIYTYLKYGLRVRIYGFICLSWVLSKMPREGQNGILLIWLWKWYNIWPGIIMEKDISCGSVFFYIFRRTFQLFFWMAKESVPNNREAER